MDVEYREIPGFPGYRIGSDGTVWSCIIPGKKHTDLCDKWKKLKLISTKGYFKVNISKSGKIHQKKVHRLLLEIFVGPCPPNGECCHFDDNRSNNDLSNLRWGTRRENSLDAVRNGRFGFAKLRPRDKLGRFIREK